MLERHRPGIGAAARQSLVGEHLVPAAAHLLPIVRIVGRGVHAAFRDYGLGHESCAFKE